jgi:hypothetical protein
MSHVDIGYPLNIFLVEKLHQSAHLHSNHEKISDKSNWGTFYNHLTEMLQKCQGHDEQSKAKRLSGWKN